MVYCVRYNIISLTTAIRKQVVIQLQHCWACLALSDSLCIIRTISAEGLESPLSPCPCPCCCCPCWVVVERPRERWLRWRGEWVDTRLRTWSVSCSVDSFPWASWIQHCTVCVCVCGCGCGWVCVCGCGCGWVCVCGCGCGWVYRV